MRPASIKKVSGNPAPRAGYPKPAPLLENNFSSAGPSKMSRMLDVLEKLGCPLQGGIYNPLLEPENKRFAVSAIQEYVNIQGFFPSRGQLNGQGLSVLNQVMYAHGGVAEMKRLVSLGKKAAPLPNPKPKREAAKPKPEPAAREEPAPTHVLPEEPEEDLDGFVCLDDEISPRERKLVMNFLNASYLACEQRMSTRENGGSYFTLSKTCEIPIESVGRKLFFRKKDIAALLLIAKLEMGSIDVASAALEDLCREARNAKMSQLPGIGSKLWAAREYWFDSLNGPINKTLKFSENLQADVDQIFRLRKIRAFFADSGAEYCRDGPSPSLRTHSTLLSA